MDDKDFDSLLERAKSPSIEVRREVAKSLYRKDTDPVPPHAATILGELLQEEDILIRKSAIYSLISLGKDAIAPLANLLQHSEVQSFRSLVIFVLSQIEDEQAFEIIVKASKDKELNVKLAAIRGLEKFKNSRATVIDTLMSALDEPNLKVQSKAADVLGKFKATEAVEALIKLLSIEDSNLRWYVVTALGKIQDERALPALRSLLRSNSEDKAVIRLATQRIENPHDSL